MAPHPHSDFLSACGLVAVLLDDFVVGGYQGLTIPRGIAAAFDDCPDESSLGLLDSAQSRQFCIEDSLLLANDRVTEKVVVVVSEIKRVNMAVRQSAPSGKIIPT
jgi:hypothetical protein